MDDYNEIIDWFLLAFGKKGKSLKEINTKAQKRVMFTGPIVTMGTSQQCQSSTKVQRSVVTIPANAVVKKSSRSVAESNCIRQ